MTLEGFTPAKGYMVVQLIPDEKKERKIGGVLIPETAEAASNMGTFKVLLVSPEDTPWIWEYVLAPMWAGQILNVDGQERLSIRLIERIDVEGGWRKEPVVPVLDELELDEKEE